MNIKPIAWMYTDRWGTHFTEDENEILDGVGIESWTPLLAEHDVIKWQTLDVREAFEAVITFDPFKERMKSGHYRHPSAQCEWEGFQKGAVWSRKEQANGQLVGVLESVLYDICAAQTDADMSRVITKIKGALVAVRGGV